MIRIKFSQADRERMGLPEVVEYELERPRLKELRDLKAQVGKTWVELQAELGDKDDWATRLLAAGVVYWLACRRAGVKVPWDEFDLDLDDVEVERDDPNPPAPTGAD